MPRLKGPLCQSCGLPLSRDPAGGGRNPDGTRSGEYCSHCYQEGWFTEPNISVDDMMAQMEAKLRELHFSWDLARKLAQQIPRLTRWFSAPAGNSG
jgi:hypothetical protein